MTLRYFISFIFISIYYSKREIFSLKECYVQVEDLKFRRSFRNVSSVQKNKDLKYEIGRDPTFLIVEMTDEKGCGVFTLKEVKKGDFVREYAGELIDSHEEKKRDAKYDEDSSVGSYMYFFVFKSKKFCVDATKETGRIERLNNHSVRFSNLSPRIVEINKVPRLLFFAAKIINHGEELLYNYGHCSEKSLKSNPWLKY